LKDKTTNQINKGMGYLHEDGTPFTKEEFLQKLKTDKEFNDEFGNKGIDQISELIKQLKDNPDSRRMVVSAWAVHDLPNMVLPPCHYGFQVYTRELSLDERNKWSWDNWGITCEMESVLDEQEVPKRAISLMWNQRSVDVPLGLPFNIASYGLLLEIIAKEVNMIPDQLIGNLGDCHIYLNQIDGVKEQISRTSFELPSVKISERNWYQHEKVKEHLGEKTFSEKILSYRPDCFELIGYQSHGKIKMPLSN
jgi:thymidylate synthase